MRFVYILFFIIIISHNIFSNNDTLHYVRNQIFIEIAGLGGYGSLNYERFIFLHNKLIISTRVGLSSYHLYDFQNKFNPDVIIPISIVGLYGNKHKIEIGLSQIISNIIYEKSTNKMTRFHSSLSIGYRFQKHTQGFVYRCCYTPLFELNKYYRNWMSISIGYSF